MKVNKMGCLPNGAETKSLLSLRCMTFREENSLRTQEAAAPRALKRGKEMLLAWSREEIICLSQRGHFCCYCPYKLSSPSVPNRAWLMGFVEVIYQISPAEETPEGGLEPRSALKFI